MKRKRMIKLLMNVGCDRNHAIMAANRCNGNISHEALYQDLLDAFLLAIIGLTGCDAIIEEHLDDPADMVSADG